MGKRGQIIREIEGRIAKLNHQTGDRPGLCLYYAHHAASVLHRHRYKAVIQAGSMQWPRVRREEDDGRINTHFAYEWSPQTPASALSVAMGNLPEIHVWVGIVDTQEVVDFTTRHLKQSSERIGMPWSAADPPRHLWCATRELPDWVVYRPNRDASIYACVLLKRLFNPAYLRQR